jgi:hypothetical protein
MDAAKLAFGFKKSERAMVAFCHGEILIAVIPPILLACAEEWWGGCGWSVDVFDFRWGRRLLN